MGESEFVDEKSCGGLSPAGCSAPTELPTLCSRIGEKGRKKRSKKDVTDTVLVTNLKHGTIWSAMKNAICIPARPSERGY